MATAKENGKAPATDDVFVGGALNKEDLFEILQQQIDSLSAKAKSPDGISRDDLKPLIKAISDLRGVGLGGDETVKKGVDFQMKMTRQLVVQQDIKSALNSRNYEDMKAAAAKAKDIHLRTRQAKTLEAELLAINKELLKKAGEENERLRKLKNGGGIDVPSSSSTANDKASASQHSSATPEPKDSKSSRFLWRRSSEKRKKGESNSAPDDYQLEDESKGDTPAASGPEKRKSLMLKMPFGVSKKNGSFKGGPSSSPRNTGGKEPEEDELMLADRAATVAHAEILQNGVSEFQRQAQFDKLVEAMHRVKVVMDTPQEMRGPSAILAAAGSDMDLVTGDPNTVHLWLGEWHGTVKASSSAANISSKTILVGEIDSKLAQGRWEIRMTKDMLASTEIPPPPTNVRHVVDKENIGGISKEKEQKYLSEIESLRLKIDELENDLKTAKEVQPHAVRQAAPEVQALVAERSEGVQREKKEEEEAEQEERRRMQSITEGGPPVDPFIGKLPIISSPGKSGKEINFMELDPEMMTMKELKQFITEKGGSIEGLKDKDDLVNKARELRGGGGATGAAAKAFSLGASSVGASGGSQQQQEETVKGDGPKIKDDERFAGYFKMLKVGLDKEAVKHKMAKDGLGADTLALDLDPETLVSEYEKRKKFGPADGSSSGIKLKDDERFAKYFKMLKVGLDKDAVKHKMVQDGLDPDVLDMDPDGPADDVPPKELAPFLKMLQYGVQREVVELKMKGLGLDPALLEKYIPKDFPRLDIKVGDDPRFKPFFKMLAVGIPRDAVKHKMISKGFDPDILDLDPNEFSPVDGSNINPSKVKKKRKRPDDGMQWKKLYWQTIDVPPPGPGAPRTVWTRDFGFELLEQEKVELRSLFAIAVGPANNQAQNIGQQPEKDKTMQILDSARAQNVAILLSRFKISIGDLKRMICTMRVSEELDLGPDDVKSILSMLPTSEEAEKLRAVPADRRDALGQAEKHFLGLMEIPRFRTRIACFLFKLQFNDLKEDVEFDIEALQNAVNDLLDSQKLARLLTIILSIGNMLNSCGGLLTFEDGFKPASGFRLSSLSKLRLAKAHTTNKTALNFFVSILHERQRQVLDFILAETDNIRAAASVVMSNVKSQVKSLAMGVKELENEVNHAESVRSDPEASKKMTQEDEIFFDAVETFFQKARRDVHDLQAAINNADRDFQLLVTYFQEEPDTTPEVLFKHLVTFFDECVAALHENDVARAKAVRKANALEEALAVDDL